MKNWIYKQLILSYIIKITKYNIAIKRLHKDYRGDNKYYLITVLGYEKIRLSKRIDILEKKIRGVSNITYWKPWKPK